MKIHSNNRLQTATFLVAIVSIWAIIAACADDLLPTASEETTQATTPAQETEAQVADTRPSENRLTLPPVPVRRYAGKRNPFSPLITLIQEQEIIVAATKPVKRDAQTTLEKIPLDQMTLTAVFKSAQGNKAIVEEVTGKGHIVEKGTFIGTQGGRIASISADRIVIVEKTVDPAGKIFTHKKELKLASPPNDPS